jgi:hypothetical protein
MRKRTRVLRNLKVPSPAAMAVRALRTLAVAIAFLALSSCPYKTPIFDNPNDPNGIGASASSNSVSGPTFSPAAGTYSSAQTVTISTATSGASIRYTTDGSDPSESAGIAYSVPIAVSSSLILKAIAYKTGLSDSSVASASYSITTSFAIPTRTITVDGDGSDWAGLSPAVTDPTGDSTSTDPGADIVAVYLAHDDAFLYIRIALADSATNGKYSYIVRLGHGNEGTNDSFPKYDMIVGEEQNGVRVTTLYRQEQDNQAGTNIASPGKSVACASCVEERIPLFALPLSNLRNVWVYLGFDNHPSSFSEKDRTTGAAPIAIAAGTTTSSTTRVVKDTFLPEGFAQNYGGWTNLEVGSDPASDSLKHYALLGFDLTGSPAVSSVSAAWLEFRVNAPANATIPIYVHRVLVDWDAGSGTDSAAKDDATWYNARTGVPWTLPGCSRAGTDYDSTVLGKVTIHGPGTYVVDLDPAFVLSLISDPATQRRGLLITDHDSALGKIGIRSAETDDVATLTYVGK